MAVKKFDSPKAKAGWKFAAKENRRRSWGFNIPLENGKCQREWGFGSRQLAENAVARVRVKEKKYHL